MFRYLYYFLALILYIVAIPFLLLKSRNPKYKEAIPAKFFLKDNLPFKEDGIWFHSCSQGETTALKPIFDALNKDNINLSVITNTGFAKGLEMGVNTKYLPYEIFLPFWITKQKVLVVMEAELWYMLFLTASKIGTKTILINARINDKSYKVYKRFSFFYRHIFKYIDKVFAQTQIDKERLIELGAKDVKVIGNIKLATLPKVTKNIQKPKEILITAGSTHKNEEKLILNAWKKEQGKLVIVPRHPERFDEVDSLIKEFIKDKQLSYSRYSIQKDFQESKAFNNDITLVDVMGELNNIYAISDVVILGGSFIDSAGGHNPIEPAFFGCKLISGKTIFNQKALFECVDNHKLVDNDELKVIMDNLYKLKHSSLGQIGDCKEIIREINSER